MSHIRNLEYLHRRKIIYRRSPITDKPTEVYNWGNYYEEGTYECYELFRSKAKITTYRSLKWHLLVLWYLNPQLDPDDFNDLAKHVCNKNSGFVTFTINKHSLNSIVYEVSMLDLEQPPKNKLRKIIFRDSSGLSTKEKMVIVGAMVGKGKKIHEDDIYQCMLDIHELGNKITITRLANLLNCSARTIHRNMGNELKKEKELLNQQL
jgi:hypothetical protein